MDPQDMLNVVKFGTFYNPASNHYANSLKVVCDRCKHNGLITCVGWQRFDLCLKCVEEVTTLDKTKDVSPKPSSGECTKMEQSQYASTRMQQKQFVPSGQLKTLMRQNQFSAFESSSDSDD